MCKKTLLHIELHPRTPVYFLFMGETQSPSKNQQITAELHVLFLLFLALKNIYKGLYNDIYFKISLFKIVILD